MLRFTDESLFEVISVLGAALESLPYRGELLFEVLSPDVSLSLFSGETITVDGVMYVYRSMKTWMEVAEQLECRMFAPVQVGHSSILQMRFVKLDMSHSWHTQSAPSGDTEKYGTDSGFFRIDKLEEPSFLFEYVDCLRKIPLPSKPRVLNAGINKGDEFALFAKLYPKEVYRQMSFVGIDHSASAIAFAQKRFSSEQFAFFASDLNDMDSLGLAPFDLIVSIGTLHCSSLRNREVFFSLVKKYLRPHGHMILGFPNCRYVDHSVRFGAKMKNYTRPELSVLWKEITFYKRYLQQHRFRVTLTGKHTLFLTAIRLPSKRHAQKGNP